jgi:hypothetical protein
MQKTKKTIKKDSEGRTNGQKVAIEYGLSTVKK